jgi:hypothetical protein
VPKIGDSPGPYSPKCLECVENFSSETIAWGHGEQKTIPPSHAMRFTPRVTSLILLKPDAF